MSTNFDSPIETGFCGSTPEPAEAAPQPSVEEMKAAVLSVYPKAFIQGIDPGSSLSCDYYVSGGSRGNKHISDRKPSIAEAWADAYAKLPVSSPPETATEKNVLWKGEDGRDKSGDWPEDFTHENGNYFNTCFDCARLFVGHKRRPLCKACALPIAQPEAVQHASAECKYSPSGKHVGREFCQYCEEEMASSRLPAQPGEMPKRPKVQGGDYRPHYAARPADAYMDALEACSTELERHRDELIVDMKYHARRADKAEAKLAQLEAIHGKQ